jgi:hypothetical protein
MRARANPGRVPRRGAAILASAHGRHASAQLDRRFTRRMKDWRRCFGLWWCPVAVAAQQRIALCAPGGWHSLEQRWMIPVLHQAAILRLKHHRMSAAMNPDGNLTRPPTTE